MSSIIRRRVIGQRGTSEVIYINIVDDRTIASWGEIYPQYTGDFPAQEMANNGEQCEYIITISINGIKESATLIPQAVWNPEIYPDDSKAAVFFSSPSAFSGVTNIAVEPTMVDILGTAGTVINSIEIMKK